MADISHHFGLRNKAIRLPGSQAPRAPEVPHCTQKKPVDRIAPQTRTRPIAKQPGASKRPQLDSV
jgi:hypothetical protein